MNSLSNKLDVSLIPTLLLNDAGQPGTIEFNSSAYSVNEDGAVITAITLTRTGGSDGAVSVTLTPSNGAATSPADFTATPIVVNFANGETSQTVTIPIVDDSLLEGNETVNLTLSNPIGGAVLGTQTTAVLTIVDNDVAQPGTIQFNNSGAGLSSYNRQDRTNDATILEGGQGLRLAGDTWKKYAFAYILTPNTLLDFDFRSEPGADIQAIGFDTDNSYDTVTKEAFQIGGAKANSGYKTAFFSAAAGTEWRYFTLAVGEYFTGSVNFLTFINDHPTRIANPQGVSVYQNIRLYERDLTDTTAPLSLLGAVPEITETVYSYSFQVTYSDAAGIRLSSLGNDDIEITRPNGSRYFAQLTNIDANPERTQVVATYTINSNLGWGVAGGDQNGQYQITLREGQITDFNGNSLGQQVLGTIQVSILQLDEEAPTATVSELATITTTTGSSDYFFTVNYQDNQGLDLNSLDSQDILVLGPNGFSAGAEFVSTAPGTNGVQALYRVVNSANWNISHVGEYRVELQADEVKDLSGNSAAAGTLGAFWVKFAPPLVLDPAGLSSYNSQDRTKNATVLDGGQGLKLTGDTWKKYAYSYTLTENTLLDFDFRSETPGADIQAIGFDTDDSYNRTVKEAFQIGGAKVNSGYKTAFFNAVGTEWQYFTLPVGQYFTGDINFLTFINDHANTLAAPLGESVYQNIRLYERDLTDATAPLAQLGALPPITETGYSYSFQVTYSDAAGIRLSSLGNDDIEITRPDGFRYLARLANIESNPERTQVVATYTMTSNLGWGLTAGDRNGQYQIALRQGQITDLNGNSLGQQNLGALEVNVVVPPTAAPPVTNVTFDPAQILSYNRQDLKGAAQVEDGGQTLALTGNTWKKYRYPYVITPDTILRFEYRSDAVGEEQAIGFDTDDSYSAGDFPAFQLYGAKPSAKLYNLTYNNYDPNRDSDGDGFGAEWQTYTIPVGEYFTGAVEYLTFINDDDVATPLSNSFFRNVQLSDRWKEDATPPTLTVGPLKDLYFATINQPYQFSIMVEDDKGLDLNSLDNIILQVSGPEEFTSTVSLVDIVPGNFNKEATLTFQIDHLPAYTPQALGQYTISSLGGEIEDINGNKLVSSEIGYFDIFAPASVGTNLSFVRSFSPALHFVDGFKSARLWIPQRGKKVWDTGAALTLDENGWVTAWPDATEPVTTEISTLLFDNIQGNYPGGQYLVLYEGEGTLTYSRDASKNVSASAPGRDVINVTPSNQGILLSITAINPENYIKNIRVIPAETETTYTAEIFNPLYLEKIAPFSTLRFMDWGKTNDSPQVNWSDRPTPETATWMQKGVPVEIMVELANTTQSNPWFNMPHQATDDYVRNFATYVRDNLAPDLTVYVEYSNEVWNSIFAQYRWVRDQANAEWPNSSLDEYTKIMDWYSRRTTEVTRIWDEVFGADKDRVIGVMAGRSANVGTLTRTLSYAWAENPLTHAEYGIDALAIAPYFGNYLGNSNYESQLLSWMQQPDGSLNIDSGLDTLFTELNEGGQLVGSNQTGVLKTIRTQIQNHKNLAEAEGLDWLAYEGGQSLVSTARNPNPAVVNLFSAANRDPRMGELYDQYLHLWNEMGGGLMIHYNDINPNSKSGSWGSLEFVNQTGAPKYDALVNFIGAAQASGF